jgi:hypothetical protein
MLREALTDAQKHFSKRRWQDEMLYNCIPDDNDWLVPQHICCEKHRAQLEAYSLEGGLEE